MRITLVTLAIIAFVIPSAHSQYFFDDFELYTPNVLLHPSTSPVPSNGGWTGWDDNAAYAPTPRLGPALTTGPGGGPITPISGGNILEVSSLVDGVQPFALNSSVASANYANYSPAPPTSYPLGGTASGGVWSLSTWIYVPQSAPTGQTDMYWIIQSDYNHLGPYAWIVQTKMSFSALGVIVNDDMVPYTNGAMTIPFDTWFQLRADMDLTNNCKTLWVWNTASMSQPMPVATGLLLVPGWTSGTIQSIECLDLYTLGGTYYVDDVRLARLAPNGSQLFQTNTPEASLDCGGISGTACLGAVTGVMVGGSGSFSWASTLLNPYDTAAVLEAALPNVITTAGAQVVNINIASPTLQWVNTLSPIPSLLGFPSPGFSFPFSPTVGGIPLTGQMLILDPTLPDSIRLSQPATLIVP
ncbi:MAG TPA: hypothetical protein PKA37_02950 [Planctomycetota bacterium]|nr:hypothetical protein [Planctomycetota bacterium]